MSDESSRPHKIRVVAPAGDGQDDAPATAKAKTAPQGRPGPQRPKARAPRPGAETAGATSALHQPSAAKVLRRLLLPLLLFVGLPTLATGGYYAFIAADLYATEVRFSVRSPKGAAQPSMLGVVLGGMEFGQANSDSMTVAEFVTSHDAVRALDERLELRAMLRRAEGDFLMRLPAEATFDETVEHFGRFVDAYYDPSSGITTVQVKAFTPEDAQAIGTELLAISEELLNGFNRRAEEDALRLAREEVARAEARLLDIRRRLLDYRLTTEELDPAERSGGILGIIAGLETEYAEASARLSEMQSYMEPNSMQVRALRQRLAALEEQIRVEQRRLTGDGAGYAEKLADYELLLLERELAGQDYSSALASLESARVEAQRQQSYIVPVVAPHLAEEALYPKRLQNTFLVFLGALLIFAIGRLILAGVRDHLMN